MYACVRIYMPIYMHFCSDVGVQADCDFRMLRKR